MTFLQVKQEHRSICHDKREWYEFVSGEFLTPQEAATYNADLRKCRIVDVKDVNKMYWCFGVRLCGNEDFIVVAEQAANFRGQILKYHYDVYIDIENELGEISETRYVTSFDSDAALTSKAWKILRAKARRFSVMNSTTAWVLIMRKEREEIMPSGYAVMYCADYSTSFRHEHYFTYNKMGTMQSDYTYTVDRVREAMI